MNRSTTLIAVATAALAATPAGGLTAAAGSQQAVIHFADLTGVRDWRPVADSSDAMLIHGRNGKWYRATFWAPCPEIRFVQTVAFVTDTLGDLDRFTSIIADGTRCYFKTFEQTSEPK
jgi:hypothetical protein